jgi:hypothetical protein
MKKSLWLGLALVLTFGVLAPLWAEDVVYLKDGSVIHGTITEETPGKKIKIETKDGNVFVYRMGQIDKITHTKPAPAAEQTNEEQASPAQPAYTAPAKAVVPNDPNARFSKFGFLLDLSLWAPNTTAQLNQSLEAGTGSSAYDYLPGWAKVGFGLGWFTNNFGVKWNLWMTYQPNDYSTDWYYGGYYAGTTTQNTSIIYVGSELEGDLSLDSVVNKNEATSVYLPLIAGVWNVDWSYQDSGGNSLEYSNTTTDFGTGIGVRGFDSSNFLWDLQCVYRWSTKGNYLTDASGYKLPNFGSGKYVDANVTGLDLTISIGFLFQ